jgi:DNA-directed RNA polymerase II subunit RPB1
MSQDIWILDTIEVILWTFSPWTISTTATSNDIREVFNVLGIEAARQVIFDEFSEVMEFSDVYATI